MIIFLIFVIAFILLCLYSIANQVLLSKSGRVVDAKVVNCEPKSITVQGQTAVSGYMVTVEFYGVYKEVIQKQFASEQPYELGTTIHARYLDQKDWFMKDTDLTKKNLISSVGVTVIAIALTAAIGSLYIRSSNGTLSKEYIDVWCFAICLIFVIIGIAGVAKKIRQR